MSFKYPNMQCAFRQQTHSSNVILYGLCQTACGKRHRDRRLLAVGHTAQIPARPIIGSSTVAPLSSVTAVAVAVTFASATARLLPQHRRFSNKARGVTYVSGMDTCNIKFPIIFVIAVYTDRCRRKKG
jgi:hypothetical protein